MFYLYYILIISIINMYVYFNISIFKTIISVNNEINEISIQITKLHLPVVFKSLPNFAHITYLC